MKSKLGIYLIHLGGMDVVGYFAHAKPRIAVSMEHKLDTWRVIKQASPNTFIVGRYYVDDSEQIFADDPEGRAEAFFARMKPDAEKMRGIYDAWMGYNECVVQSPDDAKALARFYVRWGDLMRAAGLVSCSYSFATGNPELNLWEYLVDGVRHCDLLSLHEYSAPTMDVWQTWLCLRYRRVLDALPADARRPIVITETGIDGGAGPANRPQEGWSRFTDAAGYLATLQWYDNEMQKDDYVIGAAIFAANGWGIDGSFGMGQVNLIRDYIAQGGNPAPVVIQSPRSERITPTTYTVQPGDTLYRIAQKYGVTVAAIAAANNIVDPRLIRPGQVLTIPSPATPVPPKPPVVPLPKPPPTPAVPTWYTPLPPATRPASRGGVTPPLPLNQFPRPTNDNGRGIHFGLDVSEHSLQTDIPKMVELGIKWVLFYVGDEMQAEQVAVAAWNAGMMPVIRPKCKIDGKQPNWPVVVQRIRAHNIPAYIQIYNEPGDEREWNRLPNANDLPRLFGDKWAAAAAQVLDAGGFPGLQILGIEEIAAAVNAVKAHGRTDIWNRAFFALHNYGVNHPPAYPYDEINQQEHPKATILDDDTTVLNLIEFAKWMYDLIGFVLPMIGGEGGWIYGSAEDRRYPKCNQPYHAQWHVEMYDWFRTGLLSNGQPLPDYLFSVAPWILSGFVEAEAWYGGPLGDKTETINAVKAMPAFVRRFGWDTQV